jgi:SAM-dependent methyltransferase
MSDSPQQSEPTLTTGEHTPFAEYNRFASIYDVHFCAYARRVVPVLDRLVLASLPRGARILDVCSGTGQLAAELVQRGFVVTGIDGSIAMLRIAERNAPLATFHLGDVRRFSMPETFDAAVSTFDSINYLLELAELQATFTNVCRALRPGGRFVFDMNMEEGYHFRWRGSFHGSEGGRAFAIHAIYSPETKLARNVVTWLDGEADTDAPLTFVERCHTEEDVRRSLIEAGFHAIKVHDGHRDLGLRGEIGRSFFVCEKPPQSSVNDEPGTAGSEADRAEPSVEPAPSNPIARRQRLRDIETCIDDALWPDEPLPFEFRAGSRRLRGLEEVLTTLPGEPYRQLKERAKRFDWFIPSDMVLGQVRPIRATVDRLPEGSGHWARVVYLSPLLEQQEWPVVVSVVVHELAHLILAHELHDLDRAAYEQQEDAARIAVREWGFEHEAERADEHGRSRIQEARPPARER